MKLTVGHTCKNRGVSWSAATLFSWNSVRLAATQSARTEFIQNQTELKHNLPKITLPSCNSAETYFTCQQLPSYCNSWSQFGSCFFGSLISYPFNGLFFMHTKSSLAWKWGSAPRTFCIQLFTNLVVTLIRWYFSLWASNQVNHLFFQFVGEKSTLIFNAQEWFGSLAEKPFSWNQILVIIWSFESTNIVP